MGHVQNIWGAPRQGRVSDKNKQRHLLPFNKAPEQLAKPLPIVLSHQLGREGTRRNSDQQKTELK